MTAAPAMTRSAAGQPTRLSSLGLHLWRGIWPRPAYLVVLMVVLVVYPNNDASTDVSLARPTPVDAAAVGLVVIAAARVLRSENLARLRTRLHLAPVAVVVLAGVSALFAADPTLSLAGVLRTFELFVAIPIAVVLAIRKHRDVALVLSAFIAVAAVEGAVGTYQALTHSGAGFGATDVRAVGTFGAGNQLAMADIVGVALVITTACALVLGGRLRIAAAAAATVLAVPLALSLTRGSVLAVAVAVILMALVAGWRQFLVLSSAVALAVAVVMAGSGADSVLVTRFASISTSASAPDRSVQDRYDLWQTAISMWQADALTGVGVKNFALYRDTYAPLGLSSGSDAVGSTTTERVQLLSPHNEYLLVLSEQGIASFVALTSFLSVVIFAPLWAMRRRPRGRSRAVGLALFGLGVATAIQWMYGDFTGPTAPLQSVLFGLALWWAREWTVKSPLAVGDGVQ